MSIILIGYGKMGQRIAEIAPDLNMKISGIIKGNSVKVLESLKTDNSTVLIDFTRPEAVPATIRKALELHLPIVVGTTGWLHDHDEYHALCRDLNGRVLYGSNFSIGVQLFRALIARAGELFSNNTIFQASFHEVHHAGKLDAPSGTALTLANTWQKSIVNATSSTTGTKKEGAEVPVTYERTGEVIGEHALHIQSKWDRITLKHEAASRDGFAAGALMAANWLVNQPPGFYLAEDIVETIFSQNP